MKTDREILAMFCDEHEIERPKDQVYGWSEGRILLFIEFYNDFKSKELINRWTDVSQFYKNINGGLCE